MPVISRLKTGRGKVDSRVTSSTVDMRGAGAIAGAISNIGGAIKSSALQVGQVLHKEEVSNYTDKSKADYEDGVKFKENELKEKYRGKDHKGYVEELQTYMDTEREGLLNDAPSSDAKSSFERGSKGFYDRTVAKGNAHALSESYNYSKNLDLDINDRLGHTASDSLARDKAGNYEVEGDLSLRLQKIQSHEGSRYNNKQIADLSNDAIQKTRDGLLLGLERSGRFQEGADLLQKGGLITQGMTPAENRKWGVRFENGAKVGVKKTSTQLNSDINNVYSSMRNGQFDEKSIANVTARIAMEPDQEVRDKMTSRLSVIESTKQVMDAVELVPNPNIESEVKLAIEDRKISDPFLSKAVEDQITANVTKEVANIRKQARSTKSTDYFISKDENLQAKEAIAMGGDPDAYDDLVNAVGVHQVEFGVSRSNRGPSENMKQYFGKGLKNSIEEGNISSAEETLNTIESMTRGNSAGLMRKMGIDADYAIIGEIGQGAGDSGKLLRKQAIFNLVKGKEINEAYKNKTGGKAITEDLSDNDTYKAMMVEGGKGNTQNVLNAQAALNTVTTEYKRRVTNGAEPEDAMKKAWGMFESSNTYYEGNNPSPVLIPKKYNGDVISEVLDSNLTNINTVVDDDFSVVDKFDIDLKGMPKEVWDTNDYEWIGNSNKDGVYLSGKGSGVVYNNSGKPVEFTFKDLETMTPTKRKGSFDIFKESTKADISDSQRRKAIWGVR